MDDVVLQVQDDKDGKAQIPFSKIRLVPSWVLETSPGNHQCGFILQTPVTDHDEANALFDVIIEAGLTDPGANGPLTRLMRLPIARNGKYPTNPLCRLVHWHPELRYTVEEILRGLGLSWVRTSSKRNNPAFPALTASGLIKARPVKNPVLKALEEREWLLDHGTNGQYRMVCPWHAEHSDDAQEAYYFEPTSIARKGGFHCFHAHCQDRHIGDLLDLLGISPIQAMMLPVVNVEGGEVGPIGCIGNKALAATGKFYRRGDCLVGLVGTDGEQRIVDVTAGWLQSCLSKILVWTKYDARTKSRKRIDPPANVVTAMLEDKDRAELSELKCLCRQPFLRSDGSMCTTPGYDKESGIYGDFANVTVDVPEHPTHEDAEHALAFLEGFLAEFPFEHDSDQTAALSGMLTAVHRVALDFAPMYLILAHAPGTGKSYLERLLVLMASSQVPGFLAFPQSDEEMSKVLLTELMKSPSAIVFDNMTSNLLPRKSLCTMLAEENITGRILGSNRSATVSTRTLVVASGNNIAPVADMVRRTVVISLDANCEVPAGRKFKHPNLIGEFKAKRIQAVAAAMTITRAWIEAGRPYQDGFKSLAGFDHWDALCRQPLLWLGLEDPLAGTFAAMETDPERDILLRVMTAIGESFGYEKAFSVSTLMKRYNADMTLSAGGGTPLTEALNDAIDPVGDRKLGWWLRKQQGKVAGDMKLVERPFSGRRPQYQIVRRPSVSGVSAIVSGETEKMEAPDVF